MVSGILRCYAFDMLKSDPTPEPLKVADIPCVVTSTGVHATVVRGSVLRGVLKAGGHTAYLTLVVYNGETGVAAEVVMDRRGVGLLAEVCRFFQEADTPTDPKK